MVELGDFPSGLRMALSAVSRTELWAQIGLMIIFMTSQAGLLFEVRPFVNRVARSLFWNVAIFATNFGMFFDQLVSSVFLVIKFNFSFPGFQSVASIAVDFFIFAFEKMDIIFFVTAKTSFNI